MAKFKIDDVKVGAVINMRWLGFNNHYLKWKVTDVMDNRLKVYQTGYSSYVTKEDILDSDAVLVKESFLGKKVNLRLVE